MSKPIRVALSGSGFKFPAHVGALKAILQADFLPIEIAATSGGSIIAALYAAGMPIDEMEQLALHHDWTDMMSFNPWALLTKMGYCNGNALHEWLADNTYDRTFADLNISLTIVASDITYMRPYIFSGVMTPNVPLAFAARCSASIPFAYAPMPCSGCLLVDGGVRNNIPIDLLVDDHVPQIGVQLVSNIPPLKPGAHGVVEILRRIVESMMSANESAHVDLGVRDGAMMAFVETGYVDGLDRNMSLADRQRLMDDAYIKTAAALVTPIKSLQNVLVSV
ncbi:patatin-like phospholipase family protein [Sulfuriferula sp.]|uniref:patatin-like phospholipase family protein n=1 Tax=Sulfuriferula sp. TaxID=2025307 RepID=UPI002731CA80|nr:patatin-like phospholipase family protein [Sulfuriferula sp.]MDP2026469.1 patatin-like phospholipase family protein [Sulfuriferula sp.]